jgi:succinate dehydrogenase/fumarate reductase flavoprotein subunit
MVSIIRTDVLVVGTGGAGLRAAIEAEKMGVKTIIVSKSPAGMNNATTVSGGGFRAPMEGLTYEEHMNETLRIGRGLNDKVLVKTLSREGGKRLKELAEFGVNIRIRKGGVSVGENPSMMGFALTKPLVDFLRKNNVSLYDNLIITKLIKHNNVISGAVGFDLRNDYPIIFKSKAVILATGGAGGLYSRTDCPHGTTGDGYSLAYRSGAILQDMEFVQFFPLAIAEVGSPPYIIWGQIAEEGKILNRFNEEIPGKYEITDRPLVEKSRDLLSRAMMIEIEKNRGIGKALLFDAREVFKRKDRSLLASTGSYEYFIEKLKADEKPLKVAPVCHHSMGGINIDENGYTGVQGLYAVGEVTGGIHGANRVGGNALTDIIVFGARAGAAAAKYAKSTDHEQTDLTVESKITQEILKEGSFNQPSTLLSNLKDIMWKRAGIIRNNKELNKGLEEIKKIRDSINKKPASTKREKLFALELPMALDTCEMIIKSALLREESRGAHYREDFPKEKEKWVKNIFIKYEEESMKLSPI